MIIKRDTVTTREIRSKLRDANNRAEDLTISFCISKGVLDPRFKLAAPTGVNRIIGKEPVAKFGTRTYGSSDFRKFKYKEFMGMRRVVPEKKFNPLAQDIVKASTKLGRGISLGRFTGADGQRITLNDFSQEERRDLAKHYYMQSVMMLGFINSEEKFGKHSLVVTEGLYIPEDTETLETGGIKDLATKGRVAVYEVVDQNGLMSPEKTFELAHYWKDNFLFDNLILSYDTVDPKTAYNAQIVVVMPEISDSYQASFKRKVSTEFNYNLLVDDGLAEAFVRTA